MKSKKSIIISLLLIGTMGVGAQENDLSAIHFEKGLTWPQIIQKAKSQNKYIFVDCYATWCVPCKGMDHSVYPDKEVGDALNDKFISVKVQMDRTERDNEDVKGWYRTANYLQQTYTVNSYPTFLFFSPDGKPLNKSVGARNAKDFIQLCHDALNPDKQYYLLVKNFQPGKLDTSELKGLARLFLWTDKILAGKMAADYLNRIPKQELTTPDNGKLMVQFQENPVVIDKAINFIKEYGIKENVAFVRSFSKNKVVTELVRDYLSRLSRKDFGKNDNLLLASSFKSDSIIQHLARNYVKHTRGKKFSTQESILFLENFTMTSKDEGFSFFYNQPQKTDAIIRNGYAEEIVISIIEKEELNPLTELAKKNGDMLDFSSLYTDVENKYNNYYAKWAMLDSKVWWYGFQVKEKKQSKYWNELISTKIELMEFLRQDTLNLANDFAYKIVFFHSEDSAQLKKVALWLKMLLIKAPNNPNIIDTYACILYKLGDISTALPLETKAAAIALSDTDIQSNFEKMKKGEQFWKQN